MKHVGNRIVVTGCDGKLDRNAEGACPMVLCEAAILNSGNVAPYDEVKLEGGPASEDGSRWLLVGTATSLIPDKASKQYVQCLIERGKVLSSGVISEGAYNGALHEHKGL